MTGNAANFGPSDFARIRTGRRMPIQFHADIASKIYSGLALGLFAHMAMLRDGEEFSIRQMQRTHKEGRDAWSGALAELFELGLVARVRWADGRGQWRTRYYLAQDHPFEQSDIDYIHEVHGRHCLIECSPELSNTPIQVSSRVSRRPRKRPTIVDQQSEPDSRVAVDNSRPARGSAAKPLAEPVSAIATAGSPTNAIAAAGATSTNDQAEAEQGVAAIAGTYKERKDSFLPPLPPHTPNSTDSHSTATGWREETHPDTSEVIAAVRSAWPTLSRRDLHQIRDAVSRQLLAGHHAGHLVQVLTQNTGGARIPGKLLLHRLEDLPEAPAAAPRRTPWCGSCDHRWIDVGIAVHRCPQCHPAAEDEGCPDCLSYLARHPAPQWCGTCDPEERLTHGNPCTRCHPSRASAQPGQTVA